MKIGYRKPSIKKSISARTTAKWKRAAKRKINPYYGKKGMGVFTNPNKAAYNKFYNKFTIGLQPTTRKTRTKRRTKNNNVTGFSYIICLLAIILLFIPSSDDKSDNSTTVTTTEIHEFTKEDFLINDTLINYCNVAEYPLEESELLRIQELENPLSLYSNILNHSIQMHISGQSKSAHDLVIQLSLDDTNNEILYCVFRDFIISLNSNVTIDEIETLWNNLETLDYRYSNYVFYDLNIKYDESKRINSTYYSISITYN
ncbi:MAG: hypothetical protein J6J16_08150 [Lachnospiraceae bacterium]|nr:hypothetical protein [Lachnospiraceae bacterium]